VFGDPIIATAILDRLLHHSTTLNIRGNHPARNTLRASAFTVSDHRRPIYDSSLQVSLTPR
jgi:hypothetical protein